jgi:hypothetical protein
MEEMCTCKATYAEACQVWDKFRERGHVRLVSGSFNPTMPLWSKILKNCNNMIINAHIHMCSYRANQLRIEMALIPLMGS